MSLHHRHFDIEWTLCLGNVGPVNLHQDQDTHPACRIKAQCTSRGVTLIELMLVIGIVATISGIAVPTFVSHADKVHSADATARMSEIELGLDKYYAEHNQYPETLAEIGLGGVLDPWGRPYQYLNVMSCAAKNKKNKGQCNDCRKLGPVHPLNTDYDLFSVGKDGKSNKPINSKESWDDIIRAYNGSYTGLAKGLI
jgi:general secretion pathway protein G